MTDPMNLGFNQIQYPFSLVAVSVLPHLSYLAFISTITDIMIGNKSESIKCINIVQGSQNSLITIADRTTYND
jgi:hypothetical protein